MIKFIILLLLATIFISCGTDPCEGVSCSNHGKCEEKDDKATCVCNNGYILDKLSCLEPCETITCGDNEKCITKEEKPECICKLGYIYNVDRCVKSEITNWSFDCPSYIKEDLPDAQCAFIKVPLDYENPDGKKIDIFVYRLLSKSYNKDQIIFLQGGPGSSGAVFAYNFKEYSKKYSGYDFYSLDHRGVGNSTKLSCKEDLDSTSNIKKCSTSLNKDGDLKYFSTKNAARDIGFILEKIKMDNSKQFIYSVSYGTYWAEKYLQLFPKQVDGVILDSIASINNTWFDKYNEGFKIVGERFMDIVADDPIASSKLSAYGETPRVALEHFYEKVKNRTNCRLARNHNYSLEAWKTIFGYSLKNYFVRSLIPSLLYRVHRCSAKDKVVIDTFLDNLLRYSGKNINKSFLPESQLESKALYYNIVFSELWKGIPKDELLAIEDSSLFISSSLKDMYSYYDNWEKYTDYDETFRLWPETETPILMLNGGLDPQTTLEEAYPSKEKFNKDNQVFIEFPQTPHAVVFMSYLPNQDLCGENIMMQFIQNPTKKIDKSCLNEILLLDFNPSTPFNKWNSKNFYGTEDMWEGSKSKSYKSKIDPKIKRSFLFN